LIDLAWMRGTGGGPIAWRGFCLKPKDAWVRSVRWVGGSLCLGLVACAPLVANDSPVEVKREAVRERATARWDLIIDGRAVVAYDYLSKASQQVIARDGFAARMSKTAFRTAVVQTVECSPETCQASIRITYDHPMMKGVGLTVLESWIIEGGKYFYVWPQ
jgi:hypothetical protein